MNLYTAGSLDMNFILDLYQQAFPEEQRKPFSVIERKAAMGSMEMLVIKEENQRVGLAITAMEDSLVILDYFAISEKWRGQGDGSEALMLLQALYEDRQFFLELEEPDENAENQGQILRRRSFFLKNGMHETGIRIRVSGIAKAIWATQEGLTYEQCAKVYRSLYGPMYQQIVQLIEETNR